jgi:hypothetical protein
MIPKPPSFFSFVARFQIAKGGFLAFNSGPLHMQCFLYFSIILIMVGGNLITPMKRLGEMKG